MVHKGPIAIQVSSHIEPVVGVRGGGVQAGQVGCIKVGLGERHGARGLTRWVRERAKPAPPEGRVNQ